MNRLQIIQKTAGIVFLVGIVLLIAFSALRIYTKSFSPEAQASYMDDDISIIVNYCQPHKKGRIIFGALVPYGEIWRTGANEATTIHFSQNVSIDNSTLEHGTYSLYTIPNKKKWTIIFNGQTGQWGTRYNPSKDVLRVEVQPTRLNDMQEYFTISLDSIQDGVLLSLLWDQTKVALPIITANN